MNSSNERHEPEGSAEPSSSRASSSAPAVGLVLTRDNIDAVGRSVLRATRNRDTVLVADTTSTGSARHTPDFLDADNVHLIVSGETVGSETPQQDLAAAARALEFPGLILNEYGQTQIDYDATLAAFADEEGYCVNAVPLLDGATAGTVETLVAIPAYNEGATIATVVAGVVDQGEQALVIDDGSTDDTVEQARAAGATVFERETNGGYGAALKTAFREAHKQRVDQLVILDGDGQHDPADIPRLLDALRKNGADIAIGSRFAAGSETAIPPYRRVGLAVVNLLSNLSLGVVRSESWIDDTQSGFRAYNRRVIESLLADDEVGDRMSASTDILYHAHHNDYVIKEVGTTIDYDVENGSHHNPVSHGIQLVMNIVKTVERDRPILLLGMPGFLSTFVGIGFGYWTISNFINTDVFSLGLAITSMFFVLVGVFACFSAIMLHALSTQLPES